MPWMQATTPAWAGGPGWEKSREFALLQERPDLRRGVLSGSPLRRDEAWDEVRRILNREAQDE